MATMTKPPSEAGRGAIAGGPFNPLVKPAAVSQSKPEGRAPVAEIVAEWAKGLTPKAAPDVAKKGPLAWVREVKAAELVQLLAKAGYR